MEQFYIRKWIWHTKGNYKIIIEAPTFKKAKEILKSIKQ